VGARGTHAVGAAPTQPTCRWRSGRALEEGVGMQDEDARRAPRHRATAPPRHRCGMGPLRLPAHAVTRSGRVSEAVLASLARQCS
jgi:hypothetical protein